MSGKQSKGKVTFSEDSQKPCSSRTSDGFMTMCESRTGTNSAEARVVGQNSSIDPDTARRLFEVGANLFLLDVPRNTEVGIDLNSWNTGPNFKGIKMIPPGVHFIYWR